MNNPAPVSANLLRLVDGVGVLHRDGRRDQFSSPGRSVSSSNHWLKSLAGVVAIFRLLFRSSPS